MSEKLYSFKGAAPEVMPARIRLPGGLTRTDPASFTEAEIAAAGYVEAPAAPAFNPSTHALEGAAGAWSVVALPPAPAVVRKLSRFEFMGLLTPQERIALRARGKSDPVMADALDMLGLASHVDPAHPMIGQMLGYVEQVGLMTPARRAEFTAAIVAVSKVSGG